MPASGAERVQRVLQQLLAHAPWDAAERESTREALAQVELLPRPLDEGAGPVHVTGSGIVTGPDGRVALHLHKRLGMWLQPGGHIEADEDAATAAVREVREETGLSTRHPGGQPQLLHVDVHPGPRSHVHLDLRYLLLADAAARLSPDPGESPQVAWFAPDEAISLSDASLASAIRALRRHR